MKKFIFGIIIIIILIAVVTLNLLYQHSTIDDMLELVALMDDMPSQNSLELAKRLESVWERHNRIFTLTTHVREVDNVSLALAKLVATSLDGDDLQYRISRREAEQYLSAIKDGDSLSLFGVL